MPVPTYSVIADSEIDPESPITESLMRRLRDNVLAVLGIDPATPSPSFTLAPSYMTRTDSSTHSIVTNGPTVTGTEVSFARELSASETFKFSGYSISEGGLYGPEQINVTRFELVWSAGAPTSLIVDTDEPQSVTIAVDNAYHAIDSGTYNSGSNTYTVEAKVRYSGGIAYIQFRISCTGVFENRRFVFALDTFKFQAKT